MFTFPLKSQGILVHWAMKPLIEMKQEDIEFALDMYDKYLFWDFSPVQCRYLTPEFVVPRVVRYGTLNDVMRLFVIYSRSVMRTVLEKDRELDQTERAFLTMINDASR